MNKIIIANWKLGLDHDQSINLSSELVGKVKKNIDVVVCPNFVSLKEVGGIVEGSSIGLGAQDVFWENGGAFTGEISPKLIKDAGCRYVIVGHSERRQYIGESYNDVHKKVRNIINVGDLVPIVCIGETLEERRRHVQDNVLSTQLEMALGGVKFIGFEEIIIAYEPVWVIGTGEVIEPLDVEYMHKVIKLTVKDMFGIAVADDNFRYVYGGSVNERNVSQFCGLSSVDGLLIGGASTNASSFLTIIEKFK